MSILNKLIELQVAVSERIKLSKEIERLGKPPHTDFWHQSIFIADKKIQSACENMGYKKESRNE